MKKIEPRYYVYENRDGKLVEVVPEAAPGPAIEASTYPFLRTNPFLYNPEASPLIVYSIEDFLVTVKKRELVFGDVIRDPEIPLKQRRKIVKKAFRNWKKSYVKEKKQTFSESGKIIDVLGEVSVLRFSWKYKLVLFVLFFVAVFLVAVNSAIWEDFSLTKVGNYLHGRLSDMYATHAWLGSVGNITIYVILSAILFVTVAGLISRDYQKNYKLTESFLDDSERDIDRSFKRRWKKARKYYLRELKNIRKTPPLDIGAVQEGQINIQLFKDACQVLLNRAHKYKKAKPFINGFKYVLLSLSILGTATLFVFAVYEMILSIFK